MSPSREPAYFGLEQKELQSRAQQARDLLHPCRLCPQHCGAPREEGGGGQCVLSDQARVAEFGPHLGEEAPLRGWQGSGTIFFAGCNLACVYCQNYDISHQALGKPVEPKQLASIMLRLQSMGCHNINLVSPSHVVSQWLEALCEAVEMGLRLPLVYNSGGYDSIETLSLLESVVDIYMPDMKYGTNDKARRYSGVPDYVEVNQAAVKAMHQQVGDLMINSEGLAERGLIIRHLLLPQGVAGTEKVLSFIAQQLGSNTYLNLMNQYSPEYRARSYNELKGRVSLGEYQKARELAKSLGLTRLA